LCGAHALRAQASRRASRRVWLLAAAARVWMIVPASPTAQPRPASTKNTPVQQRVCEI
jgi:hypothetical protein